VFFNQCGEIGEHREHGIYMNLSTNMRVLDSMFYDISGGNALHISGNNSGTLVEGNVIYTPGTPSERQTGININERVTNVTIRNNVVEADDQSIATSNLYNGSGNVVSNNCTEPAPDLAGGGISQNGNITASLSWNFPVVAGPSTCYSKLPADSPYRP
jgi:hypothetical protein